MLTNYVGAFKKRFWLSTSISADIAPFETEQAPYEPLLYSACKVLQILNTHFKKPNYSSN